MAQQEQSFKYNHVSSMSRPTVPISSHEFSALVFSDTQGNCDVESVSPLLPSISDLYPSDCNLPFLFEVSSPSPELDLFLGDSFGNPLSFFCTQNPELSPTTSSASLEVDTVVSGCEGINDNQTLFHVHDAITHSEFQLQKLQSNEFLHLDRNLNTHMVEKRYRVNINNKMTALRDAVPSMSRIVKKTDNPQAATVEHEKALDIIREENGLKQTREISQPKILTRPTVLSKATILVMATEYVTQLEMKNAELLEENAHLKERFREIHVASNV
ncbi:Sterol regulatory element-binding protein 1-like protein 1 [Colletotrichum chlorophyti]|uniref:Sterol regulatory element-binding protein 1-like protein 1 n=1 Tax=Colletotrichum chlorophyti TaxID=708187 RepID=A0A1Q8S2Q7_9PEZI|nr:Sterol regulatory element-binding protein 1-like protein 1 [Colletotrichum chlorophyti]